MEDDPRTLARSLAASRLKLLEWLAPQPFMALLQPYPIGQGSLIKTMEHIVVENHARLFRDALGEPWSPPRAYRWLRYEDPEPVARLIEGTSRLEARWDELWAEPRGEAVEGAVSRAVAHEAGHLAEFLKAVGGEAARGL